MSRKRDTNWSRDEITVLLDSILEITKNRANDGKRTNSREVFEHAAKKMGERGHSSRAEREKCRTKWKKMKEEFTHAKRAREGDSRYKEAPGIQPFYDRMEEFINGNFDNISPHSTIVRRTSSTSSRQSSQAGMRISARIAANTNGTSTINTHTSTTNTTSNYNNDSNNTIPIKSNTSADFSSSTIHTALSTNNSSSSRQDSRLSSESNNIANVNGNIDSNTTNSICNDVSLSSKHNLPTNNSHNQQQQQAIANGDLSAMYSSYNNSTTSSNNSTNNNLSGNNSNMLANSPFQNQSTEHADISYRVSTGCRQITIFGDHDVDIKFRGDCVTINKIDADYPATET